jgi:hypothetical protein
MRSAAASTDRPEPAPQASPAGGTVAADPRFRRLLGGAAWRRLDANIRGRFAVKPGVDEVFTFVGEMAVVRRSWYGWLLAHACRLIGTPLAPQRGRDVPTVVRIYRSGRCDGVVWERCFKAAPDESLRRRELERLGGVIGLLRIGIVGIGDLQPTPIDDDRRRRRSGHSHRRGPSGMRSKPQRRARRHGLD